MHLDSWWGDLRFAWRAAGRRPAFTTLVVLTLALGIGVNSAVFALVDAVLLRAPPYRDPSRLVFVWQTLPEHNVFELEPTPFDFSAWRIGARSFASLALIATDSYTLTADGDAQRVRGARATANLLPLLGIQPQIGRAFVAAEDTIDAAPVAILGDALWRARYGADPGILGRTIRVDGIPHTVVGVMPAGTVLPGSLAVFNEIWLPARMSVGELTNKISHNYVVIGRLADGVSGAQAAEEMTRIAAQIAADEKQTHTGLGPVRLTFVEEQTVRDIRPALLVLVGGGALLLLIACANVCTLLITRASNRRQEAAVRAALGATPARLRSLAVAESVVLSALGGMAGVTLGGWVLRALLPLFAESIPTAAAVAVDARVALVTLGGSLAVGVSLGLLVAAQKPAEGVAAALKSGSRMTGSVQMTRVRNTLVVAQIAFAVVLLAASGLMLRSVWRLSAIRPGFAVDHVLTFRLALPDVGYQSRSNRATFVQALVDRLASAPGITGAAINSRLPLAGSRGADGIAIEGRAPAPGELLIADERQVTPDYFRTMSIPILEGRGFTPRDDATGEPIAIVNRAMANRFWPTGSPLNARVQVSEGRGTGQWMRIVGIVGDVHHVALNRAPVAELYRPYAQDPVADFSVVVKTAGEPSSAARVSRAAVDTLDRDLPVYDVRTMAQRIAGSFAQLRATMLLLLVTAVLAALLAGTAIYGSIWYAVSLTIPEIGIRLALGATPVSVCARIVGQAIGLTLVGGAVGTAAAVAAAPILRRFLFETRSTDPGTYVEVMAVLLALTLVASVMPVRRAMGVDPMTALRN